MLLSIRRSKGYPKIIPICLLTGTMIIPQPLEQHMSKTNSHNPKDVRALTVHCCPSTHLQFVNFQCKIVNLTRGVLELALLN